MEEKEFPYEMYHLKFGTVVVNSESDVENCLKNGFEFEPPSKTNPDFIKSEIARKEAEKTELEINLAEVEETVTAVEDDE